MRLFLLIVSVVLPVLIHITGCAGSATHKVVSANQYGDIDLSCKEIESELIKAQVIIDDVDKDKEDMTGADVVDGILWFPFNLIAKSENYRDAIDAADQRIARLNKLKKEKNCRDQDKEKTTVSIQYLSENLRELANLHKDGILTDQEYMDAKRKILDADLSTLGKSKGSVVRTTSVKKETQALPTEKTFSTEDLTGSVIKGSYTFKGGNYPADLTIQLNYNGQAQLKAEFHNVMWGQANGKGRWWLTDSKELCLKTRRLDLCRKIVERNGSIILVSIDSSEPDWTLTNASDSRVDAVRH